MSTRNLKEFAESYLQDVIWDNEVQGSCECPNSGQHSPGTGTRCTVYIDYGFVALNCFHEHCEGVINRDYNAELIKEGGFEGTREVKKWTAAQTALYRRCKRFKAKAQRDIRPALLKANPITAQDWLKLSPIPVPEDGLAQWRLFISRMFKPTDLLWTGELWQTGKPEYKGNFRTVKDWLATPYGGLGEQMSVVNFCPSANTLVHHGKDKTVYFDGYERTANRVGWIGRLYTLVESDEIKREKFAIIQRWLDERNGMRLCALVDTGGKSFHGWVSGVRHTRQERELRAFLAGLGADAQALNHLTARAPGMSRYDAMGGFVGAQRLLYFNPPEIL